jgi:hypothetical protein
MGTLFGDRGRVCVEVRRKSFVVYADYGYETVNGETVLSPSHDTFGRHWRDTPHPEFMLEELDDLITALEEARQHLKGRRR